MSTVQTMQQRQPAPLSSTSSSVNSRITSTTTSSSSSTGGGGPKQAAASKAPVQGVCNRKTLPMGWKKLDFVLPLARRRQVDDALAQLAACPKRAAVAVHHAVANARNNAIAQGADPAKLIVERIWTGRATPFKKPWFHGRGYHSIRQRRRTNLTVVVQESPKLLYAPAKLVRPAMLRPRRERRWPRPGQLPAVG